MLPLFDEKQRRLFLASEALAYGRGETAIARRGGGASKNTIKRGIREHRKGQTEERGSALPAGGGASWKRIILRPLIRFWKQ
jgi:hypothetical protein